MTRCLQLFSVTTFVAVALFVAISTSCSTGVGTDTAFQPKIDKLQHKNYVETIPGTEVKFEMIAIPGGTFLMGSPAKARIRKCATQPWSSLPNWCRP